MPWYIQVAIEQALNILSWHENLQSEEIPPEYLWEDAEGLELWWASVENKRNNGEEPASKPGRMSVPDAEGGDGDQHQPPGMAENDYARFFKQN